ncbi:MAG: Calx-beta domain-containing protein, partial [Pseudanabaenaceae cyanobacterium]
MAVQFSLQRFELQSQPDGIIFVGEQFEIRGILIDNDATNGQQTATTGYFDVTFDPSVIRVDEISYGGLYTESQTAFNLADINAGGASAGVLDEIGASQISPDPTIDSDSNNPVYVLFTLKVTALTSNNNAVTNFDVAIGSGGVFVYGTGGDVSGNTSVSPESFFVQDSAPTVSISVLDSVAAEPNNNGSFTITRSGGSGDFSQPLVVSYTVSGTATNGTDYTSLPLTITIPANATSVTLPITVIDDSSVEGAESVQINLVTSTTNPTSYVVDSAPNQASASLNISDNDGISYSVGVQSGADILTTRTITEGNTGSTPLSFVVTRSGDTSIASSISYAFSGSATNVSDYTIDNGLATSGTINFAANETSKTISVQILGDVAVESDETILLTLSNPQPSNVNPIITNATATLNLNNDDQPTANPQV